MREDYSQSFNLSGYERFLVFQSSRAKANASLYQYNANSEKLTLQKYNVYFIYARDVYHNYSKKRNIPIGGINTTKTISRGKIAKFLSDFFCSQRLKTVIFMPITFT